MLVWSTVLTLISCSVVGGDKSIYKLSRSELQSALANKEFDAIRNVLKYEGAFAVTGLSSEYVEACHSLRATAPTCLQTLRYPEFRLPDGSLRTTFASQTAGDEASFPACLAQAGAVISQNFDLVFSDVSSLFEHLTSEESLHWAAKPGDAPQPFAKLHKKEHIHTYEKGEEEEEMRGKENFAAPFHVDNGVLLLITPFNQHPLQIKTLSGRRLDTSQVGDDSLLILVARGLPDWLLRGSRESGQFTAAPHAVPSLTKDIQHRTIFARMMIAPMEAVPVATDVTKTTFESVFFNNDGPWDLCTSSSQLDNFRQLAREPRGIGQHDAHDGHDQQLQQHYRPVQSMSWDALKNEECAGNSSYCWMSCLDLPTCSDTDHFVCTNKDNQQCCTNKDDEGTGKCADMDDTCQWKCDKSPGPPDPDRFCFGTGVDMYMKGFQVSGDANNNCVILFFESWVLDTRLKFAFACLGVILLGILVEGLICLRRLITSRKILTIMSSPVRRVSIIVLFASNIAFGYLAMLVAMTYSVELFLCMVVGLVAGHALFNTAAPVGESADPCCASQVIGSIKIEGNGEARRSSSSQQVSGPSKDSCCSTSSSQVGTTNNSSTGLNTIM